MARGPSDLTDMQILEMMHLMDHCGLTGTDVARRYGRSRSAILGLRFRILRDLEASERGAQARKPENRDGGMPPGWWRKRRAMT